MLLHWREPKYDKWHTESTGLVLLFRSSYTTDWNNLLNFLSSYLESDSGGSDSMVIDGAGFESDVSFCCPSN